MKTRFLVLFLLFSVLACNKDDDGSDNFCLDDETFCAFIENEDYEATGPLTDAFMATLGGDSDTNLEELREWLECKACVSKAELICNSCIETFPEISELSVDFEVDEETVERILDIRMTDPMTFVDYHE